MTSSHLLPATIHHHGPTRAILIVFAVIVLLMICASRAHGMVRKAESGEGIKPMSTAQYAVIKQRIRDREKKHFHAKDRQWIHWVSNISSGWLLPTAGKP